MYLTACPMSSQILSYSNRKLLAQATDVKYVVSNLRQIQREPKVGDLTLDFTYFSYFSST